MKPMSAKDKQLLVVLLALIIISASYFFGARVLMDKTTELETKQTEMRAELDQRLQVIAKQDEYEQKTEEYNAAYDEMMRQFPAGISQDDQIMFAQDLQTMYDSPVTAVNFTDPAEVLSLATMDPNGAPYSLQSSTLQFPVEMSYDEWVDLINYLGTQARGKNILTQIDGTYSPETNRVTSNVTLAQYAITGAGRVFEPETGESLLGTNNIFATSAPMYSVKDRSDVFNEVRNNYHMDLSLYAAGNGQDTVLAEDAARTIQSSASSNAMQSLSIEVADSEDGSTAQLTFRLGDQDPQTITGITDDTVNIYVFSTPRTGDEDLSGVNATVLNNSGRKVQIAVEGDDAASPRFVLTSSDGSVKMVTDSE